MSVYNSPFTATCCCSFLTKPLRVECLLSEIKKKKKEHSHTTGTCTLKDLRALWVNCLWTEGAKNSSQRWGATPRAWKEVSVFAPLLVWALCLWGCVTASSLHLDELRRLCSKHQRQQDSAAPCGHRTVDFAVSSSHFQPLNDSFQRDSKCSGDFTVGDTLRTLTNKKNWWAVYHHWSFFQKADSLKRNGW